MRVLSRQQAVPGVRRRCIVPSPALLKAGLLTSTLLMAALPSMTNAQVTAPVVLESRSYDTLLRLRQLGLLDLHPSGANPVSRARLMELVSEASRNLARVPAGSARRRLAERLLAQLAAAHSGMAPVRLDRATVEGTWMDSPARAVGGAGTTVMEADVNPLADHRRGRHLPSGGTLAIEAAFSAELGSWLAVSAQPRLARSAGRGEPAATRGQFQSLTARVGRGNVFVAAGRTPLQLGQGMHGGLFVSGNARALDMIQLANDAPAYLPGILRRLGPLQGRLFVADLGADQDPPHARLAGWKVSAMPASNLELGVSVMAQTGGAGGPPASFGERVIDLIPLLDVLALQDRDLLFSNKVAGVDFRWRHRGSGTELYGEMAVDDFDIRRARSSLVDDGAYVAGLVIPAVGRSGNGWVEGEFQRTGLRFYEHAQFRSGITNDRRIIGLPLGPRGTAALARFTWDGGGTYRTGITLAAERRSQDQYMTVSDGADDSGFRFVKVEDRPEEDRARALLSWSRHLGAASWLEAEAGAERARNFNFGAGASRTGLLLSLSFTHGF